MGQESLCRYRREINIPRPSRGYSLSKTTRSTGGFDCFFVLCSYSNFRTPYLRLDGLTYTIYPGEWMCWVGKLTNALRVCSKRRHGRCWPRCKAVTSSKYSLLDLWISAVYRDDQVQVSFDGPVAYLCNGIGCPLVSYAELAQWLGPQWAGCCASWRRQAYRLAHLPRPARDGHLSAKLSVHHVPNL